MSWTEKVYCTRCGGTGWDCQDGVWACRRCMSRMTTANVAAYHRTLCNCPARERIVDGNTCQTCRKPLT